jgi:hypothetical protein
MLERLSIATLWLFIISSGIVAGGSVVERVVIMPLWASSPPESVRAWSLGVIQRPFFEVATPIYSLLALGALVLSFALPPPARPWVRTAGALGILLGILTIAFFVPLLQKTQATGGAGLPSEEIARLTRQFVNWSWLRSGLLFAGWLTAMRGLTLASR